MSSFRRIGSKCCHLTFFALVAGMITGSGLRGLTAAAQETPGASNEANNMFRNLDVNRDGKLTLEEAGPNGRAMLERIFEMAGKQRGASVSRTEFQQVFERHRAGAGGRPNPPANGRPEAETEMPKESQLPTANELPQLLAQLDGNGDGKLTRGELQRLTQMFERLDSNKDGALSVAEIQAVESLPKADSKSKTNTKSPARGPRTPTTAGAAPSTTEPGTGNRPTAANTGNGRGAGQTLPTGVWRGWVVNGRGENPNTGQMEIELTVEGNRIMGREVGTRRAPEGIGGGTFVITGDGRSGNLDAEGTSGAQDGRSFMGIYEFDGEVLRWCVANRGRQRPQTMATDRGNYLMVLRQQK